jgi:hypothetical protein
MEQKKNIKNFPCVHGNINFVKEKFPHVFHKQLYLHEIFPSIDRKKHTLKEKRAKGLVVQIPPAAPFISMHPDNIRGRWRRLQRGRLVYGGSDSSTAGVTRLKRVKLVHRGGDLSTEGKTHLRIGRLVYEGGDLSKER